MSLKSLVNDELILDADFQSSTLAEVLAESELPADLSADQRDVHKQGAVQKSLQANRTSKALNVLTKYIPTEAVTLYVAAVSASSALESVFPNLGVEIIYWSFAVLTPVIFLLVYMNQRLSKKLRLMPKLAKWPWWRMIAATVAYLVWALAVPNNPYITTDAGAILAGVGAVFVSSFLSLLDGPANWLFGRLSNT